MHHVVLDRWSRRDSILHRRDPRAKVFALVVFLVGVALTPADSRAARIGFAALLVAGVAAARLPASGVLLRAAVVLPFAGAFAALAALAGEPGRALALVERSYLSALAALLAVGTTPLPALLRAVEWFRAPRLLVLVTQFLYRYLFVVSEQAQHMRQAAASRLAGARRSGGPAAAFRSAAGAVAVLFARSYGRAEGVHRAMISRGFQGRFPAVEPIRPGWPDVVLAAAALVATVALSLASHRF